MSGEVLETQKKIGIFFSQNFASLINNLDLRKKVMVRDILDKFDNEAREEF